MLLLRHQQVNEGIKQMNYKFKTISKDRGYELQEKYSIEPTGQRIVVSYLIKSGDVYSKPYYNRKNAIKAYINAYLLNKFVKG